MTDLHSSAVDRSVAALYFLGNVASSVFIVFVNKHLFKMGFHFPTCLSALHFITCALAMRLIRSPAAEKEAAVLDPLDHGRAGLSLDHYILIAAGSTSIMSLNLSMFVNTLSFYQVSKLMVIPGVWALEKLYFSTQTSYTELAAMGSVMLGVGLFSVEDLNLRITMPGLLLATLAVASTSLQQISVRKLQQERRVKPAQLLGITAPAQAVLLLVCGPFVDYTLSSRWIGDYEWAPAITGAALASCVLALGVNFSQYLCLGKFQAITFQVMGHAKTVLIVGGGWMFFNDPMSAQKAIGAAIAIAGLLWYAQEKNKPAQPVPVSRA